MEDESKIRQDWLETFQYEAPDSESAMNSRNLQRSARFLAYRTQNVSGGVHP